MLRNKVTGLILGGIAALGITAGATTAFAQSTDATAPAVQSAAGADTLANNELAPRGPGMGNAMVAGRCIRVAPWTCPARSRSTMH